ncbi:MAG: FG-GAP-like repeat-containing protein [Planctomycetes bacterium]|nr:FG-GAP-like repeat-containing protein [Planctomycetota bacterium]
MVPAGWTGLTNIPASGNVGNMTLLTDGRVLVHSNFGAYANADQVFVLTPSATGSYVNGTWSQLASMSLQRLYFGSNVLPDGRVFTLGGEYSGSSLTQNFTKTGEIYNPLTNTWSAIANFPRAQFGDDPTILLPDGRILAGYISGPETYLYNPATNTWSQTGTKLRNDQSDEETWTLLADGSVLSYDIFASISDGTFGHAQRYIPATGKWVDAGNPPVDLSSNATGDEFGGALLLPDGRVLEIGATGKTAYYTPSTNSWTAGPTIPNGQGADDAPAALLPNGHVLLSVDTPPFGTVVAGTTVYELDPITNIYTDVTPSITGLNMMGAAFTDNFLMLPTGQALFSTGGGKLAVYDGTGGPNNAWRPTISTVVPTGGTTFTLTGTQLTGLSAGASYGDDSEMDSNYPIIQLTDGSGNVFYARSHDWTPGVATGAAVVTTQFDLPAGLPNASYSLRVIASGIASQPFTFNPFAPLVTGVTSSNANGSYGLGSTISIQVTFNDAVTVDTTLGTPTLTLNTGGTATYVSGSGTNTLTFNYVVGAGQNTADLDYTSITALALNGATIKDTANGLTATLTLPAPGTTGSLGANKDIIIDTTAPVITSVTSTTADGFYKVGATINVTVNFSESVTLSSGTLTVNLDTGSSVIISSPFTGLSASGTYTVVAGQNSADLNSRSPLILSAGATLVDVAGNNATLTIPVGQSLADLKAIVIDTLSPTATISAPSASYTASASVTYTITYTDTNFNASTLTAEDITLITTGTATGTVSVSSGTGSTRTVTISGITGNGTLGISVAAGTANDKAGNLAPAAGPSATFVVDNIKPTVAISPPSKSKTSTGPITFTITYSDVNFNVSTLTAADITLTKTGTVAGTVSVSPGSGTTRTVTISNITGDGRFSISLASGTANDKAGNQAPSAGPSGTVSVVNTSLLAVGGANGSVRIFDGKTGQPLSNFRPLDIPGVSQYTGLVEVALGDITGDGIADLFVAAANPLGVQGLNVTKTAEVYVYDGTTLTKGTTPTLIREFTPFATHYGPGSDGTLDVTGIYINGLNIAVGDVNGDGIADLIAGTRGGSAAGGAPESGRVVVINGSSPVGSNTVIGSMTPFGQTYVKGVIVAAGDLDGDGRAEVAVTRGGPVADSNPNQEVKLKAYKLTGSTLAELNLSGDLSNPLAPFTGINGPNGEVLSRDARLAFVDQNGDGKDVLVISILDQLTDPSNPQVRIAAFTVSAATGLATAVSTGSGPSRSYLVDSHVTNHAITHVSVNGNDTSSLALLTESATSGIQYLNPRTGAVLPGGFSLNVATGGVALDGN